MDQHYPPDSPDGDRQMYQIAMQQHRQLREQYGSPVPSPVSPDDQQGSGAGFETKCGNELDEDDHDCHQHLMDRKERAILAQHAKGADAGAASPRPVGQWVPVTGDVDNLATPPITLWQKSQKRAPAGRVVPPPLVRTARRPLEWPAPCPCSSRSWQGCDTARSTARPTRAASCWRCRRSRQRAFAPCFAPSHPPDLPHCRERAARGGGGRTARTSPSRASGGRRWASAPTSFTRATCTTTARPPSLAPEPSSSPSPPHPCRPPPTRRAGMPGLLPDLRLPSHRPTPAQRPGLGAAVRHVLHRVCHL